MIVGLRVKPSAFVSAFSPLARPLSAMPVLRYDCDKQGCFNVKKRPKIEVFDKCFSGKIAMTDVDGLVEVNSRFLFLEWKPSLALSTGQRILYERLTAMSTGVTVLVVAGDPERMDVSAIQVIRQGRVLAAEKIALPKLILRIEQWAKRAKAGRA